MIICPAGFQPDFSFAKKELKFSSLHTVEKVSFRLTRENPRRGFSLFSAF